MAEHNKPKQLLTPGEVAEILAVSPVTVRYWSQRGDLKSITTPGGHRRYSYADIEQFTTQRKVSLDGMKILVVDDDEQFVGYLKDFLDMQDDISQVAIANDGFTAGSLLHTFSPSVVLLDLMMPHIDGFKVCNDIKNNNTTKKIRVIAMTGYYNNENIERILGAGAERCLKKPFEEEELLHAISLKVTV